MEHPGRNLTDPAFGQVADFYSAGCGFESCWDRHSGWGLKFPTFRHFIRRLHRRSAIKLNGCRHLMESSPFCQVEFDSTNFSNRRFSAAGWRAKQPAQEEHVGHFFTKLWLYQRMSQGLPVNVPPPAGVETRGQWFLRVRGFPLGGSPRSESPAAAPSPAPAKLAATTPARRIAFTASTLG
jgi:uncharacterized protein YggL (DUF469 family)